MIELRQTGRGGEGNMPNTEWVEYTFWDTDRQDFVKQRMNRKAILATTDTKKASEWLNYLVRQQYINKEVITKVEAAIKDEQEAIGSYNGMICLFNKESANFAAISRILAEEKHHKAMLTGMLASVKSDIV